MDDPQIPDFRPDPSLVEAAAARGGGLLLETLMARLADVHAVLLDDEGRVWLHDPARRDEAGVTVKIDLGTPFHPDMEAHHLAADCLRDTVEANLGLIAESMLRRCKAELEAMLRASEPS